MGETVKAVFKIIGGGGGDKTLYFEFPHVVAEVGNLDICKCGQK